MGQLSQLVLLAYIVTGCISYSIDSTKNMLVPEPPVDPSESDFIEYPTELINKLIASLSREELEELQKPIILAESNLGDRNGNTDITPCRKKLDPENPQIRKATDGEWYYVVNRTQHIEHYVCEIVRSNDTYDNKCKPAYPQKSTSYCCHQRKAEATMIVIPYRRYDTNELPSTIKKQVVLNSDCICDQLISTTSTCPRPASKFDFIVGT